MAVKPPVKKISRDTQFKFVKQGFRIFMQTWLDDTNPGSKRWEDFEIPLNCNCEATLLKRNKDIPTVKAPQIQEYRFMASREVQLNRIKVKE